MEALPDPHPLDFDWRYESSTVEYLSRQIPTGGPILAVGAPSLARYLDSVGRDVTLVDRQPFQGVKRHIVVDLNVSTLRPRGFLTAVVDPPWYKNDFLTWISWTANVVGEGGLILATVWPPNVRPSAADEFNDISQWMLTWATVAESRYWPQYVAPPFERAAIAASSSTELSSSPRVGRLLFIKVDTIPSITALSPRLERWSRFVFNEYQIAVRARSDGSSEGQLAPLHSALRWQWPFVSRRAPDRSKIDLWSSNNEAAIVSGTEGIERALRTLLKAENESAFRHSLSSVPALMEWRIPHPPYWRASEWSHQQ